jgi:ribosome-binding protein aMBF1 (putative translation factor)
MKRRKKTNFDLLHEEMMKRPGSAAFAAQADKDWDVAVQLHDLRERLGISQADLARKLKTSQQQISRLENPAYEGHSMRMLKRLAAALDATVELRFVPLPRKRVRA